MRAFNSERVWTCVALDMRTSSELMVEISKPIWSQLRLMRSAFKSKTNESLFFFFFIHVSWQDDIFVEVGLVFILVFVVSCSVMTNMIKTPHFPTIYFHLLDICAGSSCVGKRASWHISGANLVGDTFLDARSICSGDLTMRAFTPSRRTHRQKIAFYHFEIINKHFK